MKRLLSRLQSAALATRGAPRMSPTEEWQTFTKETKLADVDGSVRLKIGDLEFILMEESGIFPGSRWNRRRDWIVVPKDYGQGPIRGFVRIRSGDDAIIGPSGNRAMRLLDIPPEKVWPDLHIINSGGTLALAPFDPEGYFAVALPEESQIDVTAPRVRLNRLKQLLDDFGVASFAQLPPKDAMALLNSVQAILDDEAYRPLNSDGEKGAIIEIPDHLTPVIVGDVHANLDNVLRLLSTNSYLEELRNDRACLIFVGDLVHEEAPDALAKMDSSILMLDFAFLLKRQFPRNVFILRGNHESFTADVTKGGIPQGLILEEKIKEARGEEYRAAMENLFNCLPYIAVGNDFIACHAAPTRSLYAYETLIDIKKLPGIAHEITRNRLKRPGFPAGYTKGDVKRFRRSLNAPKKTPLIVGHTPYSREGAFWLDIGKVKNHHVIYSARDDWIGLFTRINNKIVALEYRAEPLVGQLNQLIEDERDQTAAE